MTRGDHETGRPADRQNADRSQGQSATTAARRRSHLQRAGVIWCPNWLHSPTATTQSLRPPGPSGTANSGEAAEANDRAVTHYRNTDRMTSANPQNGRINVNDHKRAITNASSLDGAESNTMSFPEIVAKLMQEGFEGYAIDFRRARAIYICPTAIASKRRRTSSIAPSRRLLTRHAFKPPSKKRSNLCRATPFGFCKKAALAGCAGYVVSFSGPPGCFHSAEPPRPTWNTFRIRRTATPALSRPHCMQHPLYLQSFRGRDRGDFEFVARRWPIFSRSHFRGSEWCSRHTATSLS